VNPLVKGDFFVSRPRNFRIFLVSLVGICLFRALLKILAVDTQTGFYQGPAWVIWLFYVFLAAASAGIWLFTDVPCKKAALYPSLVLEISSLVFGTLLASGNIWAFSQFLSEPHLSDGVNMFPTWLLAAEHLLGIASGIAFIILALFYFSGASRSSAVGALAVLPAVWQPLNLIVRYVSFRQVNTNSDQLLETLFLVAATMFFLYEARYMAGIVIDGRRSARWALLTALLGFCVSCGQAAARAVLGPVSGPDFIRLFLIFFTAAYAWFFAVILSCAPPEEPKE
jgi:hypothetical protein